MSSSKTTLFIPLIALSVSVLAVNATTAARPDIDSTTPLAACALQTIKSPAVSTLANSSAAITGAASAPVENPSDNYEASAQGVLAAAGEPSDAWVRLLLLTPRQALLIDVAIQIDGKVFRLARNDWLDGVVKSATATAVSNHAVPEPAAATPRTPTAPQGPAEAAKSTTTIAVRNRPTLEQRLATYLEASGGKASREELQWFVNEAGYGAPIVTLNRENAWQRAIEEPLWAILDRNHDDLLSREEIDECESAWRSVDENGNDVLERSEISDDRRRGLKLAWRNSLPLVTVLDESSDWSAVGELIRTYCSEIGSAKAAGEVTQALSCSRGIQEVANDLVKARQLATIEADLALWIRFYSSGTQQSADCGIALLGGRADLVANDSVFSSSNVLSLDLAGDALEISASQVAGQAAVDPVGQIAIGAVIDGYALSRIVDRDNDHRLTRRERDSVASVLASCDRNQDGKVVPAELPIPIRLGITLGPHVHQLLKEPAASARGPAAPASTVAPEWFTTMDKNHDGDLSLSEFLGTNTQFAELDRDHDNLISGREAIDAKLSN